MKLVATLIAAFFAVGAFAANPAPTNQAQNQAATARTAKHVTIQKAKKKKKKAHKSKKSKKAAATPAAGQ